MDFENTSGAEGLTSGEDRQAILANPGFGLHFTDHMARAIWHAGRGWHDSRIERTAPLPMHPATHILHYGQAVFEGLKAYRHQDGSVWRFRADANARRLQRSCARMALPLVEVDDFLRAIDTLVNLDREWVPEGGESSLYLRPFLFGSEVGLPTHPAHQVEFVLIAAPSGDYFSGGVAPIRVLVVEDYVRAAPGGTGAAKFGGNYAAGFIAQSEGEAQGCDQVLFLDAVEHRWLEELGGMNVMVVMADGTVVTPPTSGTILEGVTREAVLRLARDLGHGVEERPIGIDELVAKAASGEVSEFLACGTAAVVNPIGSLVTSAGEVTIGDGGTGKVTADLRRHLVDIQYGRASDPHGWMTRIC